MNSPTSTIEPADEEIAISQKTWSPPQKRTPPPMRVVVDKNLFGLPMTEEEARCRAAIQDFCWTLQFALANNSPYSKLSSDDQRIVASVFEISSCDLQHEAAQLWIAWESSKKEEKTTLPIFTFQHIRSFLLRVNIERERFHARKSFLASIAGKPSQLERMAMKRFQNANNQSITVAQNLDQVADSSLNNLQMTTI